MPDTAQIALLPALEVVRANAAERSPNGVRWASFGQTRPRRDGTRPRLDVTRLRFDGTRASLVRIVEIQRERIARRL